MLAARADVNAVVPATGMTPLMTAAATGIAGDLQGRVHLWWRV